MTSSSVNMQTDFRDSTTTKQNTQLLILHRKNKIIVSIDSFIVVNRKVRTNEIPRRGFRNAALRYRYVGGVNLSTRSYRYTFHFWRSSILESRTRSVHFFVQNFRSICTGPSRRTTNLHRKKIQNDDREDRSLQHATPKYIFTYPLT